MSVSFSVGGVRVRLAGDTHVGMRRPHNEDSLHLSERERLCVVADGMGGHASGEVASRIAVESVAELLHATGDEPPPTWPYPLDMGPRLDERRLQSGIWLANSRIFEEQQKNPEQRGMGTTIVCALFSDSGAFVAHVGDSRAYRLRDGELTQLTEDHSLVNDYIQMRRLDPADAARSPHRNVIVRALGMKESVQVDMRREELRVGDLLMLCSDGLSGMISNDECRDVMRWEPDLDRACARLIEAANTAGGMDNITVALARVERL